eukprot:TRINITY_DN2997_c0_g1_i1.p1 TRINITY_DN2997_c0_g1~~TRINITY_DN2997_c0_g1_i1.p1  ORF type:complete len:423 (+),score=149.99 TRINITY_DN2997_c0_g1_i1:35-1303(+)
MGVEDLPQTAQDQRDYVHIEQHLANYTHTITAHDAFISHDINNAFSIENFARDLDIKLRDSSDPLKLKFDMENIDPALANSFRRLMMSHVPTMAVERVFIHNNTSVVQDEVLAHRLGLVPILVDPFLFEEKDGLMPQDVDEVEFDDEVNEFNSLKFALHLSCRQYTVDEKEMMVRECYEDVGPSKKYYQGVGYSCEFEWIPQGEQAEKFYQIPFKFDIVNNKVVVDEYEIEENKVPIVVFPTIPLVKLRPGQEIHLEMLAFRGIGKYHAKWQPVCPCSYALMPEIRLKDDIDSETAEELQNLCLQDIFEVDGDGVLTVNQDNLVNCTTCRECIRLDRHAKVVNLLKKKTHMIFNIESVGQMKPGTIFIKSIDELRKKALNLKKSLDRKLHDEEEDSEDENTSDDNNNDSEDVGDQEDDEMEQ